MGNKASRLSKVQQRGVAASRGGAVGGGGGGGGDDDVSPPLSPKDDGKSKKGRLRKLLFSKATVSDLEKEHGTSTPSIGPVDLSDGTFVEALGAGVGGGVGQVFRVVSKQGLTYAVKVFDCEYLTPFDRDMVKREIFIMEALAHANIVKHLGHDFALDNHIALFMEYFTATLRDVIRRSVKTATAARPNPMLDARTIAEVSYDIASGLHYLHTLPQPIVHRDLKPENIFMEMHHQEKRWLAKIGDFGEAKAIRNKNAALHTRMIGTEGFRAPELYAKGSTHNMTADIWSFGMVLFEMLTLSPPYSFDEAATHFDLIRLAESGTRPSFPDSSDHPGLITAEHATLTGLFTRCTEKTPTKRPSSKELMAKLYKVAQSTEPAAPGAHMYM